MEHETKASVNSPYILAELSNCRSQQQQVMKNFITATFPKCLECKFLNLRDNHLIQHKTFKF